MASSLETGRKTIGDRTFLHHLALQCCEHPLRAPSQKLFCIVKIKTQIIKKYGMLKLVHKGMGIMLQNFKNLLRKILWPFIFGLRYIFHQVRDPDPFPYSPIIEINNRAILASANYIEKYLATVMLFSDRKSLIKFALQKKSINGLCFEFGVWSGDSINYIADCIPDETIYGFDSFEGLKEDWIGTSLTKSFFDLNGVLPKVNKNVILVKGWFHQSVPNFLNENEGNLSFVHFDADTYESTALVLNFIGHRIVKGSVIVFDEYFGFPNWQNGEYRAWKEFIKNSKLQYEYLGFSTTQAALRII